ncbi:MAG: TrbI/VirB10 family protein [Erythrobacter sp.]
MSERDEEGYVSDQDSAPVVATAGNKDWSLWIFLGVLAIGGIALYSALSAAEQDKSSPRTSFAPGNSNGQITSPPPLALPRRLAEAAPALEPVNPRVRATTPIIPQYQYTPSPFPEPRYAPPPVPRFEPTTAAPAQPSVVYEARNELPTRARGTEEGGAERVSAERLTNPSLTVPKGTIIPAVLETALDSTQAGGARALVQRDVHSFDGSRVLIERGSRLYGEYEATLTQGQNRAAIVWGRLLRPDGVIINLDSPASDPLGRAGVKGKVDSKFWQRFGGAILQSVLDIGVGVATREAGDGVFVALPGSTQSVTQSINPDQITPTLKVKHGTSVSVFVSRDLDFSSVER